LIEIDWKAGRRQGGRQGGDNGQGDGGKGFVRWGRNQDDMEVQSSSWIVGDVWRGMVVGDVIGISMRASLEGNYYIKNTDNLLY